MKMGLEDYFGKDLGELQDSQHGQTCKYGSSVQLYPILTLICSSF